MKKILIGLSMLFLAACGVKPDVVYFVPMMERSDGRVVETKAFPMKDMAQCLELKKQFDADMEQSPDIIAHSSSCLPSDMKLVAPVEPAGVTKSSYGSI